MKIVIDLDDTLLNFIDAIADFHNSVYGTSLTRDSFHSYNFWEVWGGTKEEAIEKVEIFFKSKYFNKMRVIEGAREFVDELKKDNELYIVTARPDSADEITRLSIDFFFPNSFKGVYLSNRFGKNGVSRTKKDICDIINPDVVIEDSADYANELVKDGRKVFLFNRRWNVDKVVRQEVIRVNFYEDILAQYRL